MKVQATKVFAKFINETAKERNFNFSAELVEISPDRYGFMVGSLDAGEIDFNYNTGKIKTLKIVYPYEYFCNPVFVSTDNLTRNFRRYGVKNMNDLKDMICDLYAV